MTTIAEKCPGVPLGDSGAILHSLLFADDQMGLCATEADVNTLISAVDDHCAHWKIKLNKKKGWVMITGPEGKKFDKVTHWGQTQIPIMTKAVYLGATLDAHMQRDTHALAQLDKAQTKINMLAKFFSNRSIHSGLRKLALDMLVKPTLEMGTATWAPTAAVANKMQSSYNSALRKIVGAHSHTSGAVVGLEMGARTLTSCRQQHQLHTGKRILDMQPERLTKQAVEAAWPKAPRARRPDRWNDTLHRVLQDVKAPLDIFEAADPTVLPLAPCFKSVVAELLIESDSSSLEAMANKSQSLQRFLTLSAPHPKQIAPYLDGPTSKGASLLALCRAGSLMTKEYTKTWTDPRCPLPGTCPSCNLGTAETISHLLLHCPAYQTLPGYDRGQLDTDIAALLTPAQVDEWQGLPDADRVTMLLGDSWLGGPTKALHVHLMKYLNSAWTARRHLEMESCNCCPTHQPAGRRERGHGPMGEQGEGPVLLGPSATRRLAHMNSHTSSHTRIAQPLDTLSPAQHIATRTRKATGTVSAPAAPSASAAPAAASAAPAAASVGDDAPTPTNSTPLTADPTSPLKLNSTRRSLRSHTQLSPLLPPCQNVAFLETPAPPIPHNTTQGTATQAPVDSHTHGRRRARASSTTGAQTTQDTDLSSTVPYNGRVANGSDATA